MPYRLLERLTQDKLPVDIAETEDIHKLLSLAAAGLVVATIPPYIFKKQGGNYASAATVKAVTPAGFAAARRHR